MYSNQPPGLYWGIILNETNVYEIQNTNYSCTKNKQIKTGYDGISYFYFDINIDL